MLKLAESAVREQANARLIADDKDSFGNLLREVSEERESKPQNGTVPEEPHAPDSSKDGNAHDNPFTDRKSISEVLHDIYDGNVQ